MTRIKKLQKNMEQKPTLAPNITNIFHVLQMIMHM